MMQKAGMTFLEQFQYLKGMTVRTGVIHEAQALQLRNFPLLVPGIKKAKTEIDTDTQIVYFTLSAEPKFRLTPKRREMIDQIVVWVRTIVWDETVVVFYLDGEVIFDTRSK